MQHEVTACGTLFQDEYDEQFVKEVYSAPLQTYEQQMKFIQHPPNKVVRIQYETAAQYKTLATLLHVVPDLKVSHISYVQLEKQNWTHM